MSVPRDVTSIVRDFKSKNKYNNFHDNKHDEFIFHKDGKVTHHIYDPYYYGIYSKNGIVSDAMKKEFG